MDNWQKLCEQVIPLIKNNVTEDLFHSLFETYLKTIFNWDIDSIRHKMLVPMGRDIKEADIVLVGSNYGIVIEMKNPSVVLGDKKIGQLTSYMRILRHKFGFLIGNEFRVFYDNDTNSGAPVQIASFEFDPNNSDGISLCNILDKSVCSNEKLKEYAVIRIKRTETEQKIKQLETELLNNNGEKIKEIIKNKLMSDGYGVNYINDILNNIAISYKSTNNQPQIPVSPPEITNGTGKKRAHDNTRYRFMDNEYGKGRIVLAIINDYIQKHDSCTLVSLQTAFPKRLQGTYGVVDTFENANEIYTRTMHKRHFLSDRITLSSGQQIVVCKEWGIGNINRFINKAREIGYNIAEI